MRFVQLFLTVVVSPVLAVLLAILVCWTHDEWKEVSSDADALGAERS